MVITTKRVGQFIQSARSKTKTIHVDLLPPDADCQQLERRLILILGFVIASIAILPFLALLAR